MSVQQSGWEVMHSDGGFSVARDFSIDERDLMLVDSRSRSLCAISSQNELERASQIEEHCILHRVLATLKLILQ